MDEKKRSNNYKMKYNKNSAIYYIMPLYIWEYIYLN